MASASRRTRPQAPGTSQPRHRQARKVPSSRLRRPQPGPAHSQRRRAEPALRFSRLQVRNLTAARILGQLRRCQAGASLTSDANARQRPQRQHSCPERPGPRLRSHLVRLPPRSARPTVGAAARGRFSRSGRGGEGTRWVGRNGAGHGLALPPLGLLWTLCLRGSGGKLLLLSRRLPRLAHEDPPASQVVSASWSRGSATGHLEAQKGQELVTSLWTLPVPPPGIPSFTWILGTHSPTAPSFIHSHTLINLIDKHLLNAFSEPVQSFIN